MRYEALAPFYDRLMNHVEYDEWFALIGKVIKRYGNTRTPTIFEIGGGTGVLGSMLKKEGFRYQGSDYCWSMCKVANGRKVPFTCADARSLPIKKKFDLVLFLYDGINYLQSADEYAATFTEVARILKPGGLFLFDITTETNSLQHFNDFLDFEDYGDYSFVRHSYYNDETTTQFNDFTIYKQSTKNKELYEKYKEQHSQKVFPVKYIEEAIPRSLLQVVGIWDGYTFRKHITHSERIHFLLKKSSRHDPVLPRQ